METASGIDHCEIRVTEEHGQMWGLYATRIMSAVQPHFAVSQTAFPLLLYPLLPFQRERR